MNLAGFALVGLTFPPLTEPVRSNTQQGMKRAGLPPSGGEISIQTTRLIQRESPC